MDRIMALENEEREKKSLLEKLKREEETLIKGQPLIDYEENYNETNEQLVKEVRERREELREKQVLLRKKEKHVKTLNDKLAALDKEARRVEDLIAKRKANPSAATDNKKEENIEELKEKLRAAENDYNEQKKKCKRMTAAEEKSISDMNFELEKLTLVIKQRNYESRVNTIRINELKKQLRASRKSRAKVVVAKKKIAIDPKIMAFNINSLKEDIKAEESIKGDTRHIFISGGSVQDDSMD